MKYTILQPIIININQTNMYYLNYDKISINVLFNIGKVYLYNNKYINKCSRIQKII